MMRNFWGNVVFIALKKDLEDWECYRTAVATLSTALKISENDRECCDEELLQ